MVKTRHRFDQNASDTKARSSVIARRALFSRTGGAFAGTLLLPRLSAAAEGVSDSEINPKDARFGAAGDWHADDTRALQAAADECFGSPASPNGTAGVALNKVLRIPPGHYRITSPIQIAKLQGGRIIGGGRFVTKITNSAGGPVLVTNGCGYSHFEAMCLESSGKTATIFDLTWDRTPGGPALQSNTFVDMFFNGGGIGVDVGAGGYMGSENLFVNCFWGGQTIAGLKTSNFNALQNTVIGGNFQNCNMGIWVQRGSVPLVESAGFQLSKEWDIRVDNSANDALAVCACRTESSNFVKLKNGVHACILSCSQAEAGPPGYFLQNSGCPVTVERCVTLRGQVALSGEARLTIRGSSFGARDWLSYSALNSDQAIELEDVQYGGTPNNRGDSPTVIIAKQRITRAGVFDYSLTPAK